MIVPANTNSTVDNAFMTGEQSYKYYNEFIWKGRYAECISVEETIRQMRNLFYIASEYQVLVKDKSLYSSVLLRLPAPKILVFYNGMGQIADREELRLSAAYESLQGELELKVTGAEIRGADGVERGGGACNHRVHPGGDSVGVPVPQPGGGNEGEHI